MRPTNTPTTLLLLFLTLLLPLTISAFAIGARVDRRYELAAHNSPQDIMERMEGLAKRAAHESSLLWKRAKSKKKNGKGDSGGGDEEEEDQGNGASGRMAGKAGIVVAGLVAVGLGVGL